MIILIASFALLLHALRKKMLGQHKSIWIAIQFSVIVLICKVMSALIC